MSRKLQVNDDKSKERKHDEVQLMQPVYKKEATKDKRGIEYKRNSENIAGNKRIKFFR